jgi:hypothetical protein
MLADGTSFNFLNDIKHWCSCQMISFLAPILTCVIGMKVRTGRKDSDVRSWGFLPGHENRSFEMRERGKIFLQKIFCPNKPVEKVEKRLVQQNFR